MIVKNYGELGDKSVNKTFREVQWFVVKKVTDDCNVTVAVNTSNGEMSYPKSAGKLGGDVIAEFDHLRGKEVTRRGEQGEMLEHGRVTTFTAEKINDLLETAYNNVKAKMVVCVGEQGMQLWLFAGNRTCGGEDEDIFDTAIRWLTTER